MSNTHYDITINLDGNTSLPLQIHSSTKGLVVEVRGSAKTAKITTSPLVISDEVKNWKPSKKQMNEIAHALQSATGEWAAADMSARPDTWEIEEPMRFQSFAHMPLNDMGQAECITVLAYHLWQLQERLTGGDGSHKSCDPIRIGYAPHSQYTAYSYVWSELDGQMYVDLADLEAALIRVFTERMANLLANGRKREGVKW